MSKQVTVLAILIKAGYQIKDLKNLILLGAIFYGDEKIYDINKKVLDPQKVFVKQGKQWVSRGAYKLLKALETFAIKPAGLICLDIGSSTGGFTEVLLAQGAKKVYALDVGTNQLDYKLRINPQVVVYEKKNLKTITKALFAEELNLIVADVSFISLKAVFIVLNEVLVAGVKLITLIKPQFEASSNLVSKGGVVAQEHHPTIIAKIKLIAKSNRFKFLNLTESPIKGHKAKNIEYLALFIKE